MALLSWALERILRLRREEGESCGQSVKESKVVSTDGMILI
jgi:hypothetical protein